MTKEVKNYGVVIGKFQPFHKGHADIIDQIVADGLTPVILIQDSCSPADGDVDPIGAPFMDGERIHMIRAVYPDIAISVLKKHVPDLEWAEYVVSTLRDTVPAGKTILKFHIYPHGEDHWSQYTDEYSLNPRDITCLSPPCSIVKFEKEKVEEGEDDRFRKCELTPLPVTGLDIRDVMWGIHSLGHLHKSALDSVMSRADIKSYKIEGESLWVEIHRSIKGD